MLAGGSLGRRPEHAETGAIDQHVAVEAAVGQDALDLVGGARVEEVDGKRFRLRAGCGKFGRERIQRRLRAAEQQQKTSIARRESRDVPADSG